MAGCGCGGAGQWQSPTDGLVAADTDAAGVNAPGYFWTGEPSSEAAPPPEIVAKPWNPATGRTEE
jgi:hypothetical protein